MRSMTGQPLSSMNESPALRTLLLNSKWWRKCAVRLLEAHIDQKQQ